MVCKTDSQWEFAVWLRELKLVLCDNLEEPDGWEVEGRLWLIHVDIWQKVSEDAQSCLTLCDPMDCSPPGSSVHGILQARVLEWIAISFSRESSRPRDQTRVSRIPGRCFNLWATSEAHWTGILLGPLGRKKKRNADVKLSLNADDTIFYLENH